MSLIYTKNIYVNIYTFFQGPIESPVTSSYLFFFFIIPSIITQQRIFSLLRFITIRLCYTNHLLLRLLSFSFFFFSQTQVFRGYVWKVLVLNFPGVYMCYISMFFVFSSPSFSFFYIAYYVPSSLSSSFLFLGMRVKRTSSTFFLRPVDR